MNTIYILTRSISLIALVGGIVLGIARRSSSDKGEVLTTRLLITRQISLFVWKVILWHFLATATIVLVNSFSKSLNINLGIFVFLSFLFVFLSGLGVETRKIYHFFHKGPRKSFDKLYSFWIYMLFLVLGMVAFFV